MLIYTFHTKSSSNLDISRERTATEGGLDREDYKTRNISIMKIKSLAIIAVSTVLLLAGISVTGANPIAVHTAATNDVTTLAAPPRRPQPQPTRVPPAPQLQSIRIQCGVGQVNNVDPIVMPGMAGMSHYHQFFGNRSTDENTTTASLRANRPSTCRNRADFSAYWAPQLWQGSTAIVPTSITILYAKTVTSAVVAHPAGLVLIAGNSKAVEAQDLSVVSWYCGNNVQNATATPQACNDNQDLVGLIRFPECWNGKDLDSADHKSHVTYAVNGVCATGTVALPQIQMHIHYPAQPNVSTLAMSSGSIYSLHADFMNGWNQRGFEGQVAQRLR